MKHTFIQGIRLGLFAGGILACLGLSAYQERDSVRNDTMEGAESLGTIGTTKLTVTGELELRYYYDEDFYSFVPAGDTLTWSATVPSGLIANQTFVVILTENFEMVQLLLGSDYFSRSGVTTVVPGQTYYVHCTSSSGHGSYTFSLQTNKNEPVSPTLRTISVSGATALKSGESANYSVLAAYSDGSTKNVNADEWKISSGTAYASINSSGRLTAKTVSTPQTVTIQAKFGGKTETMTVTISPLQVIKPDLVPGAPNGWSAPLVVSTDPYDVIGGQTLLTSDALYFHYSVRCNGNSANVPFDVVLSVDGERMVTFTIQSIAKDGFGHNDYGAVIPPVVLPAGRHVVKIVIDSENSVVESNESNNTYETVINVLQTYSIVYYAGAYGRGTCKNDQKLEGRETVLAGSVFERTGYVQKGWSLYDGGPKAYRCGEVYRNDETLILYPYWEPNEYDIVYDLRGGHERGLVAAKGVYDREFAVSAPEREGYEFSGWCVTDGLDPTTAKWVKTHDPEDKPKVGAEVPVLKTVAIRTTTEYSIESPKMRCVGSVDGVERFKNLTTRPGGVVTLTARWRRIGGVDPAELFCNDELFSLSAANVYDGFVFDGDRVVGSVQVKTAKGSRDHVTGVLTATVTATVSCQGKKWSYSKGKVDASGQAAGLSCTTKGAPQLQVTLGENGLTGVWGDFVLSGSRNRFADKTSDAARLLSETYQRSWTVCTELDGRTVPLQLLVQAKGVVKVTGTLPDGTKVSATTQLVLDEDGTAYVPVSVPLYRNVGSLSLLARIGERGAVELAGTDEWTRSDGKSVTGVSALTLIEGGATEPPQTMGFTASANNTVGVQFDAQVVINGLGNPAKFTAKGLPAGLKIDAATGRITGVPTKTGTFAVGVSVAGSANSKWPKATDTVEIKIGGLPPWAQGAFTGYSSDRRGDVALNGSASMIVSNVGKISGKMSVGGTNWTFSATGYSTDSESDAERFVVSAHAKAGKLTRDVQLTVSKADGPDARLLNGKAEGDADGLPLALWRTVWTDKSASAAAKEVLAGKTGVYTVQLTADCSPCGTGYLSLTIDAKGTVKASGKLADGTSVSASSPLFFDKGLGDFVILHLAPSAYKGGALFLPLVVSRDELGVAAAETPVAPSWTSFNAQATGVYGDGFVRGFDAVCGGWYNKLDTLRAYYETLAFRTESPELEYVHKTTDYDASHRKVTSQENRSVGAVDTLSQEGCRVTVLDNGKLKVAKKSAPVKDKTTGAYSYEGLNDGALTVSFTQATGIFKGSYTFWYDYESADDRTTGKTKQTHGSKSISYEGIEVQGLGLHGFYLWDATGRYTDAKTKKEKTYKYKLSYPVSLAD